MKSIFDNIISLCSRRVFLLCIFVLSAGLFTGIFFSVMIPDSETAYLLSALQTHLKAGGISVLSFLLSNTVLVITIIVCSLSIYSVPLCFAVLFTKSVSIGFCGWLLLGHQISLSPALFLLEFLLPNIFTAALLLLFTIIAVTHSYSY